MCLCVQFEQWVCLFNDGEVEISKGHFKCVDPVAKEGSDVVVLKHFYFCDDIEDHWQHCVKNGEEYQKGFQITNDCQDHRYDVAVTLDYSHKEEAFDQDYHYNYNQNYLGYESMCPKSELAEYVEIPQKDMQQVDVISGFGKPFRTFVDGQFTIVEYWINKTDAIKIKTIC